MFVLADEYRYGARYTVRAELKMVVNDRLRKCVAFVAARLEESRHQISGTMFFVAHPIEDTSHYVLYVVSARHCIERCAEISVDASVNLRLNKSDGTCTYFPTKSADWKFHPDGRIDVAAFDVDWSAEDLMNHHDHLAILTDWFAVGEFLDDLLVNPGDDLYFPGLFVRYRGQKANIPIIRTGTIAAMPDEPVETALGLSKAYLAEVRSIGGHSGSPVFLHIQTLEKMAQIRHRDRQSKALVDPNITPLLGLVHGHFKIKEDGLAFSEDVDLQDVETSSSRWDDFNSGIAIVVPAEHILETLNHPDFVKQRAEERDRILSSGVPSVPD